jgi:hypothetical protein
VDFSGYVDKFYTKEIFEFDIKRLIKFEVDKVLKSLKINPYPYDPSIPNYAYLTHPNISKYTQSFLGTLIDYEELTIRKLRAIQERSHLNIEHFKFNFPDSQRASNSLTNYSIHLFQFLEAIFGDRDTLKVMISRMSQKINNNPTFIYLENDKASQLEVLLGFIIQNQNYSANHEKDGFIAFRLKSLHETLKGELNSIDRFLEPFCEWDLRKKNETIATESNLNLKEFPLNSFEVMYEAFELYEGIYRNKDLF